MRLKRSLPLLLGVIFTAGAVSLSGAVACSCDQVLILNSDRQSEDDWVVPLPEVIFESMRSQPLRDAEPVPDGMVPIVYGYPTAEGMEAAKRGEIILGGCLVRPGQPKFGFPDDGRASKSDLGSATGVMPLSPHVGGFFDNQLPLTPMRL